MLSAQTIHADIIIMGQSTPEAVIYDVPLLQCIVSYFSRRPGHVCVAVCMELVIWLRIEAVMLLTHWLLIVWSRF